MVKFRGSTGFGKTKSRHTGKCSRYCSNSRPAAQYPFPSPRKRRNTNSFNILSEKTNNKVPGSL